MVTTIKRRLPLDSDTVYQWHINATGGLRENFDINIIYRSKIIFNHILIDNLTTNTCIFYIQISYCFDGFS